MRLITGLSFIRTIVVLLAGALSFVCLPGGVALAQRGGGYAHTAHTTPMLTSMQIRIRPSPSRSRKSRHYWNIPTAPPRMRTALSRVDRKFRPTIH